MRSRCAGTRHHSKRSLPPTSPFGPAGTPTCRDESNPLAD